MAHRIAGRQSLFSQVDGGQSHRGVLRINKHRKILCGSYLAVLEEGHRPSNPKFNQADASRMT